MDKHIELYLASLLPELAHHGISVDEQRPIDYGCQLRLALDGERAVLNVYYSQKRGVSTVVGGQSHSRLKGILHAVLGRAKASRPLPDIAPMHAWQSWIGSDESGKGDYFGPLVVAAFAMTRELEPALARMGVRDCKLLRDREVYEIALGLHREFPANIHYILLRPKRYNELYASFSAQGKNLNDLLAWLHATVDTELLARHPFCEGILVDQFSVAKKASTQILLKVPAANVVERTGAERDTGVAAASVIARYQFLKHMALLEKVHKMKLPLGASKAVRDAAKAFVDANGRQCLGEVAKLHFKTTAVVVG